MSGLYGIVRHDGAPVAAEWLERMRAAMAFWGPDGAGQRIEGPAGMGFVLRELNPEDRNEQQPRMGARGLVTAAARLDNREELLQELGVAAADAERTPDGRLVGLAFDRWGEAVCEHLEGDWSLAAWDAREHRLLLARDATGNSTLYYYAGEGWTAFATSLKALLALPGIPHEPDLQRMAEVLVVWQHEVERTAYEGFRRLVWAQAMTVDAKGQQRLWKYWSPAGLEPLRLRDEEYVEAYLELYERAVRSCLRTRLPVAATLSGGRDSGSVVALVAPLLAAQGKGLTAYTSVPLLPPDGAGRGKMGDEWELAQATATMAGDNIRHVAVDAAGYGVLGGIRHLLDVHDGPGHAAGNHFWLQAIFDQARTEGAGVLLTGAAGNGAVSWGGNASMMLALQQGRAGSALRQLLHSERNAWWALKQHVLWPVAMELRRRRQQRAAPGGQAWRNYSALRPEMAERLQLDERMRAAGYDGVLMTSPLQDRQHLHWGANFGVGPMILAESGARQGVAYLDPTASLSLVEFALRVPDDQFRRAGRSSWLFQRAFRDRMPEAVVRGRQKGLQAADVGHRLLQELPALRSCLEEMKAAPAVGEVLDMGRMESCVRELEAGVTPQSTERAHQVLLRGLGVGLFLLRDPV